MTELFKEHEVAKDSPRVVWMKSNRIQFKPDVVSDNGTLICFSQSQPRLKNGYGITEDDAITDFAKRNGIKLWSEEGL